MILDPKLAKMTHDAAVLAAEKSGTKSTEEIFQGIVEGVTNSIKFRRKMVEATIKAMVTFEHREEIYQEYADSLSVPEAGYTLSKEQKQQILITHILREQEGK